MGSKTTFQMDTYHFKIQYSPPFTLVLQLMSNRNAPKSRNVQILSRTTVCIQSACQLMYIHFSWASTHGGGIQMPINVCHQPNILDQHQPRSWLEKNHCSMMLLGQCVGLVTAKLGHKWIFDRFHPSINHLPKSSSMLRSYQAVFN